MIREDILSGAPNVKPDNKNNGRYEKYLNVIRKSKSFFADSIIVHSGFLDVHLKVEAFKVGKGFGIIFSDLDALKMAEKTPYDSQKGLATNPQSAPDCIFIFDLKGTILHGNRAGERLTGYAWEEIKGKSFFEVPLFAPEYLPKAARLLELSAAGESTGPDEFELIGKDGSRVSVEISTCPIGRGEEVEVIAIAHDITERKKSEEALRKSEERYEAIVETSLDGIYQVDTSGKFTFINEVFASTFGYKREELLGKQFSSLLSAEIIPKVVGMMKEVLSGKNVLDEVPVQHKDGHEVLVNFGATPLKDCGKIVGLTGILRDVTERRRMEEELAKSEAKYRSFIETTSAGVAIIDLKGELTLVNEALCRMTGYSQEELLGRNFADFLHPDDKENVLNIFAKGLDGEKEHPVLEFRGIHKDGHSVWFYSSPTPIVQGDEMTGFSAVIRDITARKKAEEELRDSEERFRSILENAPFGYYRVGKDGLWQYVNPVWERMHGFSLEEVIGKPFEITQTEDAVEQSRELIERALAREAIAGEFSRLRKDGDIEYHSFNIQPVKHGNEIVAIEGFISDITERKKAEEALRQSEERFRNVLDNSLDMIYWLNLKTGEYDYVAPSSEKVIGYTPDELIALGIVGGRSLVHPDDSERLDQNVIDLVMNAGNGNAPSAIEYRFAHKKLGYRWMFDNRSIVYDGDEPVALVGSLRDITERKQAEEELWSARERLQRMFDSVKDGVCVTDLEAIITDVNPKGLEMYRASAHGQLIGKSAFELIVPQERGKAVAEMQKVLEQGTTGLIEHNVVMADGSGFLVEMNVSLLKDISGNATGFVAVLRDITERKLMERRLEFLSTIVEQANDAVTVTNLSYEITYINDAAQRMFGYSLEELVGKSPGIFNIEPNAEGTQNEIYQAVSSGRTFLGSALNRRKDGSTFVCEFKAFPLYEHGEIVAYAAFQRDITERKQMEEALSQSEARFRSVLNNSPDLVYRMDLRTGKYDYLSPASRALLGYSPEEYTALSLEEDLEIVHPEDRDMLLENCLNIVTHPREEGKYSRIEYRALHRELGYRWFSDSRAVIYDDRNAPVAVIGNLRDITEHKQAEEAVRESERKFRSVLEHSVDVIYQLNLKTGTYDYVSPSSIEALGYSPEELIAFGFEKATSVIHPDDVEMVREHFNKLTKRTTADDTAPPTIEYRVKHRKSGYRWMSDTSSVLCDEKNGPIAITGNVRDITKRKKAEEELRHSEVRFRGLFESMSSGVAVYEAANEGQDFIFKDFNKAGERIEKVKREDLIGKSVLDVFPGVKDFGLLDVFRRVCRTGNPEHHPISLYKDEHVVGYRENYVYRLPTGEIVAVYDDATERKRAEDTIRESEERYRALVDTAGLAGEGIMIVERVEGDKAVIAFGNDALSGMLGYQREEMLGMPARDLFLPGDRIWLQDKHRRKRKGEALPSHYGVMALCKDGSMLPIEISMGAMRYQGKSATVVYVRDVTERKKAEEALRESEAQFRAIFDGAAIGVGLLSIVGQPFRINPALREMLGYTVEELRSMAFTDYMHPDDATVDAGLFQEMLRGKRDHYQVETRYIRKDGQMVWGRTTLSAVRGLGGKLQFAIGMIEDITDSKIATENLRKSEEYFRSLIENALDAIVVITKDGIIKSTIPGVNPPRGYKPEEVIGTNSFSEIHPEDMPKAMDVYEELMLNPGISKRTEMRVRHKDGSWRTVEVIARNLLDDPAVGGIVVNYRDVTEREQAHEELLRHTRRVEALHAIAQAASQTLELEELLNISLDRVIEVMEAEAGCVYLLDMVEKELVLRTSRGLSDETIARLATIKLNENNVQKIKEWKGGSTPLRKIFEETGLSITKEAKEKEEIQSFAAVPFVVRGQLSGLIAVGNRAYRKFSPGDIDLLRTVGNQIGIGMQNAMLYEEVRALIRETIDAQERERERICLEVHDGVAQTLVSAFQYLQALEATAPDDTRTKQLLAKTSAQVKQAIQESREVINSLQPATLSDLGLVSTLRQELKRLGQETGLKIDFKADAIRLPKDIETGLYRIIHEAVFNARKHADTKQLRVKINSEDERVKVEVRDWGKGFDRAYLDRARKRGTGLFSIRKRAELMKGACEIQSEPGQGTTVRVEIPVNAVERSSG